MFQRQIEDIKRREEAAARRNGRAKDRQQDDLVNELNAKFMESLRGSGGGETQGKLDSSQINDGDFERIMTGILFRAERVTLRSFRFERWLRCEGQQCELLKAVQWY